ncbi:hypothetical protein FH972_023346 [Carpinus fangiana]|uniref:Major facilitator superfamily (MFS) profile domain-containing protein n=1 Tax=Carpinus fangiana TaxID=176857 RepID=A0A5N6KV73_9ROSI|nr:hypothetical protein FH972_023346 [Carpinus fangiana]
MAADNSTASVRQHADEQTPLLTEQPTENGNIGQQPNDEDGVPLAEEPSTAKLAVILGSCWIGVFLAAMDTTIVATLSASISTSFDSFTLLSWLASAYLIANAAVQPLSGRLTDIFSRRTGLLWSNIFFLAGNLLCGLAQSEWQIIAGRVVAGIGGGCLNTISTFVASDMVPLRRRGVWQGFGNIAFGLGSGIGGVFGGWINDVWDWRWAFLIQVPLILVSGIVVFFVVDIPVKEDDRSKLRRVDFLGSILLVTSLVLLLLGLNSGGNNVPWSHPLVTVSLPLSAAFLAAFVYVEDQVASEPVIPVRLLLERTVAAACLTNWFSSMAYFGFLYYGPIFFQVQGYSAAAAGARLIPSSIGASIGSLGSGLIMKATGKYYLLMLGVMTSLIGASALLVAFMTFGVQDWLPFIIFFAAGLGYGGMLTITLLALISAVDHKFQAVITSASYAFRSTGSTIGITISSAVFQNVLTSKLWASLGNEKHAADLIKKIRDSLGYLRTLPHVQQEKALEAYLGSLQGVWVTVLGLCILSTICGLCMRENVLHSNLARK